MKNVQSDKEESKDKKIERLERKVQEYLDGWKRAKADLSNFKKDIERRQQELHEFMTAGLVLEILSIHNHFKRALEHIPKEDKDKEWVVGIVYIKSQLDKFLKDKGVEEIKTIGEKFNPEVHEAVDKRKVEGKDTDVILEECSVGYVLNGKVIMPAKVVVAE